VDEHVIAPRRSLPPVPPPQRTGPGADHLTGTTLAPPAPADQTSWYDPQDLLADSLVHHDLGSWSRGTAAEAARDLLVESGRVLVLDEQLLAALDAAAKAAEARRALTAGLAPAGALTAGPATAAPGTEVALVPAQPPLPAVLDDDDDLHDAISDDVEDDVEDAADDAPVTTVTPIAVGLDPAAVDVAAEFARHDDLVETGRHSSLDDRPAGATPLLGDTGRHHLALRDLDEDGPHGYDPEDDGVPTLGSLTHRTVVTRSSGRRWIPVGVGAGVLSIVAAVLLTSGFGADAPSTSTDEAARTGAASTEAATPSATTPSLPAPAMNTLDLSGPVVVDDSSRADDTGTTRATTAARPSAAAVQPQVATPPPAAAESPVAVTPDVVSTPATATVITAPSAGGGTDTGGSGTGGSGSGGSGSGGSGTGGTSTQGTGDTSGSATGTQG